MTDIEYNRVMVLEIPVAVPPEIPEDHRTDWVYDYQSEIIGNTQIGTENVKEVRDYHD